MTAARPARPALMFAPRRYLTVTGAGIVGAVSALVLAALFIGHSRSSSERRAADIASFLSFEREVAELGERGGAVVIYGMKPSVADVAEGRYPDDALARMASGWAAEFHALRDELAAMRMPEFLVSVRDRFDAAFHAYVRTAEALLDAARRSGDERAALVDRAVALGGEADQLYDDALTALDRQRAQLGLPNRKGDS